jgi:hypothetical protein
VNDIREVCWALTRLKVKLGGKFLDKLDLQSTRGEVSRNLNIEFELSNEI